MSGGVLIYTNGDKLHGMGHVSRQLVLADALLALGIPVGFETPPDTPGHKRILQWVAERPTFLKSPRVTVNDPSVPHKVCIIDIENGPRRALLESAREKFRRVVVVGGVGFPIHDQPAIDALVDLQIYQSVAVNDASRSASRSLVGCEYLIINPAYLELRAVFGDLILGHDILILMGGSDPHGLTDVFCKAAQVAVNGHGFGVRTVIGPGVDSPNRQYHIPKETAIFHAPPNLVRPFAGSRCVVSALGMTTYEALCVGLPVASVNWSPDHEETAKKLEQLGVTVNLGQWSAPDWGKMKQFIDDMAKFDCWEAMSKRGRELVDGRGVGRVADEIARMM